MLVLKAQMKLNILLTNWKGTVEQWQEDQKFIELKRKQGVPIKEELPELLKTVLSNQMVLIKKVFLNSL